MERGHTSLGVAGVSDSPPTSCSLGLWGRSGHPSDCHSGGDHWWGGGARVGRSFFPALPAQLLPPPCPAPAPSEASCVLLEVGIRVPL